MEVHTMRCRYFDGLWSPSQLASVTSKARFKVNEKFSGRRPPRGTESNIDAHQTKKRICGPRIERRSSR
jgi:hypothetical protein